MITVPIQLTAEQFDAITSAVVAELGSKFGSRDGYSADEVANRLGVSKATIIRRINAGSIPVIPHITPTRIPADYVERMMKHPSTNG